MSYNHIDILMFFIRWYKAPELLYGSKTYDLSVDIWAIGCIFGEMLANCAIFRGENDIDHLFRIVQVLGVPSEKNWPVCTASTRLPTYIIRECLVCLTLAR
jgi:serine/threonine protein kinase